MIKKNDRGKKQTNTRKKSATSPQLTGGHGFTFETSAGTVYITALLCETTAAGLIGRIVKRVSFQQSSTGYPLDDLIVEASGANGHSMTLSLQVKHSLVISSAKTNIDFREIIRCAYHTIIGNNFKPGLDRVGAIVGHISDASFNDFTTLCDWAKNDSSINDFEKKINTKGFAGNKAGLFNVVKEILSDTVSEGKLIEAAFQLLRHFILIRFDLLHEGATTEAEAVNNLANILPDKDRNRADDLWQRLLHLVNVSKSSAASFDRKALVAHISKTVCLKGAPSLNAALNSIEQETHLAIGQICNSICSLNVPRNKYLQQIEKALQNPGLVLISGLPGSGKSAVLRAVVEKFMNKKNVLFLKSDRLQGNSWSGYASANNIPDNDPEALLIEMQAAGSRVLFIDGLDRIAPAQRNIIKDILDTIKTSKHLAEWSVVATLRDTGIEPVRNWFPFEQFKNNIKIITVTDFDDDEARQLCKTMPVFARLLATETVQPIVRRPFFANILAKEFERDVVANSEIDLSRLWWKNGGYAAESQRILVRQKALMELAKGGAKQLGRDIPIKNVDAVAVDELKTDGIIRSVREGQTVQFVHDIYFEWAFLQYLISEGEQWPDAIRNIGEPPALGRVVELLSQEELMQRYNWVNYLEALEADKRLRTQWLRAWITGPFSLEVFKQYEKIFSQAILSNNSKRLAKLVVWYQAEKTQPNMDIVSSANFAKLSETKRLLYADMLAYPSDFAAWKRFCIWLLDHKNQLPKKILFDVVSVFSVWQYAAMHVENPLSQRIFNTCFSWLTDIEHLDHQSDLMHDYEAWKTLKHDNKLKQLETQLRYLILQSAFIQKKEVSQYLQDFQKMGRVKRDIIEQIFTSADILAQTCPTDLVNFSLKVLKDELPIQAIKKYRHAQKAGKTNYLSDDLFLMQGRYLAISREFSFPPSPIREPFFSLMKRAPDEGRRLIRELSNHSIKAWWQLKRLSHEYRLKPLPLILNFPWGKQVFWGDVQCYIAARGYGSTSALSSGLMALEEWAFRQIEEGCPVDNILKKVLEEQHSVAILAVAVAISLHKNHCSPITLAIATNQRIWHMDIKRFNQDSEGLANLLGFMPKEQEHGAAVRVSNARQVRQMDIRCLAMLMVMRRDDLGKQAAEHIQSFPENLPFEYAEQRNDTQSHNALKRWAQLWSETGNVENYVANMNPDTKKLEIRCLPKKNAAEVSQMDQNQTEMIKPLELLNWTNSYFKNRKISSMLSLEEAIQKAKGLYSSDLFQKAIQETDIRNLRQAAVVGVAAVVSYENATQYLNWATDICLSAINMPEKFDTFSIRETVQIDNPVLFATKGLGALFNSISAENVVPLQVCLTKLVAHRYETIAVAALEGLFRAWEKYPDVAFAALRLTSELALTSIQNGVMPNHTQRQEFINKVINIELQRISEGKPVVNSRPHWPDPWVKIDKTDNAAIPSPAESRNVWQLNSKGVDVSFLQNVVAFIPIDAALSDKNYASYFLDWCEGLARWTIERVQTSLSSNKYNQQQYNLSPYDWNSNLYEFFAEVCLRLSADEGRQRFLAPVIAADDETFTSMCEGFTSRLVSVIVDSKKVPDVALKLLATITKRILQSKKWQSADLCVTDMIAFRSIVQDLFFSLKFRAELAARFANGDWSEVAIIIPLFEPILKAYGTTELVATAWITLLENSFMHYPVKHFVENIQYLFENNERNNSWRQTLLPAKISGLIQRFSERASADMHKELLKALDKLVDMGDRRAAAVQQSEVFRTIRTEDAKNNW